MISTIASYCRDVAAIIAIITLLVKPIRNKVLGFDAIAEGQKCLLRSEIISIYYYRRNGERKLKEFEFKNLEACYNAYKALGGNSFVTKLYEEMQTWEVEM